ncbi:hypothetical protein N5D13_00330 [Stenotrophomonas maltophilia]|uniref:hypothetical protein n=1 Tax=Stenotrophomonas maltophilia TaxID=40324 RepID=UPI00244BBD72|nr:hypothetical protein [Stenotrophomonas maltophilia]MDH0071435.1 hypothetical protein [Stenotrophomonas maltophilia]MDH0104263.1 hypothetical protein [Stenotrophomonas maltophilia]MDH0330054.1 hypothetical protein [Stenotrophomonas maltophilia]MDH0631675.1 hypothetical protein [Stenotrophomonas maltophilia]MDH0641060.1 hypothetical protein [Stenotrophomonas maltophilia]
MNTVPPSFIESLDVMRDDNMGLVVLVLFVIVVSLVNLVSILIEYLWLALRHWMQRRKGNGS